MLKRNLWKLTLSFAIVLWSVLSLLPLKDRDVPTYIAGEVRTKNTEFQALLDEARARHAEKKAPSVFVALRDIANERRIDLAKEYFPDVRLESSLANVTKRNNILLDHLLSQSKGRLQLGLDLKGGVAFVLEADESAVGSLADHERKEKLSKAIEIIGDRVNGLGVAEPVIRPVGPNRIEVQLAGINTRDNPEILNAVKKPARLSFHIVHPFARPGPGVETPAGYEIKLYEHEVNGQPYAEELFIKRTWEMTGENVESAFATISDMGAYEISLNFNDAGARQFADATGEVAKLSQQLQQRTGNPKARASLAIVLDGTVFSAPGVEEAITGGRARIFGQFSQREAIELANVLNNPLDLPLAVQSQYEVGPSLAADSIASGRLAFFIGTAVTAIFIVVFYTTGGLLAVAAMTLNVLIILGVMASMGATLTMPGIAGIVLTIGMSVDSNILIFERMKEERALGKSLAASLEAGFDKAFSAILDGNLTTLITAGIMVGLGTGPVKGFGVTLAIGIFSTMFAALVISRLFLNFAIYGGWVKTMPMFSVLQNTRFDFLKHAKVAFIVSWAIVAAGIAAVAIKGERIYGIDFTGGDEVSLSYAQKPDLAQVRDAAAAAGVTDLNLSFTRAIGSEQELLRIVTKFDQAKPLVEQLSSKLPASEFKLVGESRIGPSVGAEIRANALWALFWSVLGILIYVAFRFEIGYGMGAVVSTAHDVLMTIGLFVLVGGEFNAAMVAAILLIVGYSINDTIVVFDRIREELKLDPHSKLRDIINKSLNLTLSRTIITGGTTFLTAIVLATVAGGEINDIAVTLIFGVITGTFSSLFIAAPVFYWWHKGDRDHVEKSDTAKPVYDWDVGSKISGAKPVGGSSASGE